MTGLGIKKKIAKAFDIFWINDVALALLNMKYKNNYIRIINYHEIDDKNILNFENHIAWYSNHFEDCNYNKFRQFLDKKTSFKSKPGLMITFDDGFIGNYLNAYPILKKYGFTGYYYVSPGLVGQEDYMNVSQLKELITNNHVVGCHTYTHHRMDINDSNDILIKEILESKIDLESMLSVSIDIFCWVGGEEETYTKNAAQYIKNSGYKYSMMSNSEPVTQNSNWFQLQRANIHDNWGLSLVKFQVSGIIDIKYRAKCKRVKKLTNEEEQHVDIKND